MSANASGTSVGVRADARACVFAAAVQGCSKHAGKPVTANQARENHPSAQRREPTIPHFLCLSPFLHYSLDFFFSLSRSFIPSHFFCTFPVLLKCNFVGTGKVKHRVKKVLQNVPLPFAGIPGLYLCTAPHCSTVSFNWQMYFTVHPCSSL